MLKHISTYDSTMKEAREKDEQGGLEWLGVDRRSWALTFQQIKKTR